MENGKWKIGKRRGSRYENVGAPTFPRSRNFAYVWETKDLGGNGQRPFAAQAKPVSKRSMYPPPGCLWMSIKRRGCGRLSADVWRPDRGSGQFHLPGRVSLKVNGWVFTCVPPNHLGRAIRRKLHNREPAGQPNFPECRWQRDGRVAEFIHRAADWR